MLQFITLRDGRRVQKGLRASTRGRLAAATPYRATAPAPLQCCNSQGCKWDIDGNDFEGDCTVAAPSNAISMIIKGHIANAVKWASQHGDANGANIPDVLTQMQTDPLVDDAGQGWVLGPHSSIDYTDLASMQAAIATGLWVNIGIDAGPLQQYAASANGWVMPIIPRQYQNYDHSVFLGDYGPASWLAQQYAANWGVNVQLGDVAGETPCYGLYTWASMGICPVSSVTNQTGEAWGGMTVTKAAFIPPPAPTPTPSPSPTRRAARLFHVAAERFAVGSNRDVLELLRYGEELFGIED